LTTPITKTIITTELRKTKLYKFPTPRKKGFGEQNKLIEGSTTIITIILLFVNNNSEFQSRRKEEIS